MSAVTIDTRYTMDIALAANQTIAGQLRQAIDNDSDFLWRAVSASTSTSTNATGTFQVRFNDGAGYYYSTDYIDGQFLTSIVGITGPYVIWPQAVFKAGSYIGIDIRDTSGAANKVQLVFWGARHYLDMDKALRKAMQRN